jgi:hypothetical protein
MTRRASHSTREEIPESAPLKSKMEISVQTAATDESSEASSHQRAFEAMNGYPVLRQPAPAAETGGALGWLDQQVLEPVFRPEVVSAGSARLTDGLVAAIKRKNPFCLLNPLIFAVDW